MCPCGVLSLQYMPVGKHKLHITWVLDTVDPIFHSALLRGIGAPNKPPVEALDDLSSFHWWKITFILAQARPFLYSFWLALLSNFAQSALAFQ